MWDSARIKNLRNEASARFAGRGDIVGVAIGGQTELTVFLAHADKQQEQVVRDWANKHAVSVSFVVSGPFKAGSA